MPPNCCCGIIEAGEADSSAIILYRERAARQDDKPPRSEAIRRMVEIVLKSGTD
jgi:hypothetical protein